MSPTRREVKRTPRPKSSRRRGVSRENAKRFIAAALEFGAQAARIVSPKDVVTGAWVRWKCQFGCGGFDSSLVCPPRSPKPAETRAMLDEYSTAILFQAGTWETKKTAVALEREVFLAGYYKAFGFGAGPCPLCKTCAFDQGCRHPEDARPSMEACGIDVFATARRHGFPIEVVRDEEQEQHYYGLVLVE
jgi:predicted metal-binding protein